jgi:hypothetical protein
MKITVLQPNFFPYRSYFDVVGEVDKVIFADDSFYNKKSWVDRTIIKRGDRKFVFKIPIVSPTEISPLSDITIVSKNWKRNFLKMVGAEYKDSPNFGKVFSVIKEVVNLPTDSASMIAAYSVFRISELLQQDTKFSLSSVDHKELTGSFKQRIIKICKKEKSNQFHTFAMYRDTFNSHFFIRNNVNVSYYCSYKDEKYSMIHHLMNEDILLKK